MLRILHLADIHLGMENYGRVDPTTGLSSRLGDFLYSLDIALDYAIDHQFDLVLLAGDVYKNRDPSPTIQREFARRIRRLSQAGIPTFLLVGNHDLPNTWARAHTVEIFDTLAVPNIWVAHKPGITVIPTPHGPVQIAALPWVTYHTMLTKDEFRSYPHDQLNQVMADKIEQVIDAMAEQLDPALPAIFTAHAAIHGARFSSEQSVSLGQDVLLPLGMICRREFDYVALGHIHKYQVLASDPLVIYPGSLERIDFGEERDPKGFVTVTLDEQAPRGARQVEHEFHEGGARRFLTLEVHTNGGDPNATVIRKLETHADDIRGAIVRVIIKTTAQQEGLLRDDEIRKALTEAAYVASVSREIDTPQRTRLGEHSIEQLTPRQALELYFSTTNVPRDRAETLLGYAGDLIGEPAE